MLYIRSSLCADCNTFPRDAAFAPATINCYEKTFLELGSFPATPFPKSSRYWPANGALTDHLWSLRSENQQRARSKAPRCRRNTPCTPVGSFVYPKNQILFSYRLLQPSNCPSSPCFGAYVQQFNWKTMQFDPIQPDRVKSQSSGIKLNSTKSRKVQGYNMWSSKSVNTESDSRFSADEKKIMLCFALAPK